MANEIRVLIVEDDHEQCELMAAEIAKRIAACVFLRIRTESAFVARFAEIVGFPPHFSIVRLYLKWCAPEPLSRGPQLTGMHCPITAEGSGFGLWVADRITTAHFGRLVPEPTTPEHRTRIGLWFPAIAGGER